MRVFRLLMCVFLCCCVFCKDAEVVGAAAILKKYVSLICFHASEVLRLAVCVGSQSYQHFALVAQLLADDISGQLETIFHNFYATSTNAELAYSDHYVCLSVVCRVV